MYKLQFTLKQHTPIIHFQHDQDGATLRATEVKPKLDRFIIEKLGGIVAARAANPDWFISKDHEALDYKLRIEPNSSETHIILGERINSIEPFFGNMGIEYGDNKKALVYSNHDFNSSIIIKNEKLNSHLTTPDLLTEFFALNNFGTRQSKGFGSFSLTELNRKEINFPSTLFPFHFSIPMINGDMHSKYKAIFKNINWFYKSIRSGLNEIRGQHPGAPKLYFKSLLFQYVNDYLNTQWDKKTIKKHFLNTRQTSECGTYADDIVCRASRQTNGLDFKNFKDLFGLSSLEKWGNTFTLTKTQAKYDNTTRLYNKITNTNEIQITRFKSPMFFKIILDSNTFEVYFNFQTINTGYNEYINSIFCIENNINPSFYLPFPNNFDYNHFINWILTNVDIENRFVQIGHHNDFSQIKSILINLFQQLNNNRTNA